MGLFDMVLDRLAAALGKRIQGHEQHAAYRDSGRKGTDYSVESMVCESLANMMMLEYSMPIEGGSARARMLDEVSDAFVRDTLCNAVAMGFLTGDSITVPSWNGRSMDNVLVDAGSFAILGANGHEVTSMIYVVDEKQIKYGARYTLLRLIELVPYIAQDGTKTFANRYKTFIAKDGTITDIPLSEFPDWAAANEEEWVIPNVDRLLIGRYRSFTLNPLRPNAQKGTPICFGASAPIREIHYLTQQMHEEFGLSEKAIIADKTLFKKELRRDGEGNVISQKLVLPKGRERLFMDVGNRGGSGNPLIQEWAPTIQLQPYIDALEKQYQEVEKCVGVSSGILSNLNDQSYQNVDNVRKSTIKTQSFVNTAREVCESYLSDMVYAWNAIMNFYGVTPVGDYHVEYKWSDEYINTFSDQQNAILAGEAIGATDAVDYRVFVMGESPEVAKERVAEIKAEKAALPQAFEEIRV
ncbi:MAG: portal protein [Bacteriophage sp.]|nr:MAG: portal protein [Bacteriophage sp.]